MLCSQYKYGAGAEKAEKTVGYIVHISVQRY